MCQVQSSALINSHINTMSKKIGRNDPCPCGSGKKYKRCCLLSDQLNDSQDKNGRALLQSSGLDVPKLKAYIASHNSAPLLDYLIALQLNPQNHGKNLRIEHLAQLAVSSLGRCQVNPNFDTFHKLIDEEYPFDVMEDLPINMFTEVVVFHGGNYVFFPGLSTHVTELFRAMTEAIYYRNDIFQKAFQQEIQQGVSLLLALGDLIAYRADIKGMVRGNDNPRGKIVEPLTSHSYFITERMMTEILDHYGLNRQVLDSFICDSNDPNILTEVAEQNPLLYKPIIKYDDGYYFIGTANQGCAINNHILKIALKYNCLPALVEQTQYSIWMRIGSSCISYMRWQAGMFADLMHSDEHYSEELFQIDVNWLAYVCYAKDTAGDVSVDGKDGHVSWDMDAHLKTTLSSLRGDARTKDFHILTLVLYSSMGETFALATNNQPDSDYLLLFSAFDFLQLVQTEKWNSMSLVRFARTKESKPYLNMPFNQALDIYSIYKHYGESFYVSDKNVPTILHIEPNDGCHLIFESKEKLNFHGTPLSMEGRFAYIPVQRDMDYAEIYKSVHPSLFAKCCESYSVPVWALCKQNELKGLNPSSIIDTVITAVAFWMDALKSSIGCAIEEKYNKTVEIELCFSEEDLSDKGLHSDLRPPQTPGAITVSKNDNGVVVRLDHDFILSFMGPNNASERRMMQNVIMGLLDMDQETATRIIDEHIPFGDAKMILMTEASNNPVLSPLWLYSPIYIHQATSQMLLDLFPKWMGEKGYKFTKLNSKTDKEKFLHDGVDVLLEKLEERIAPFESHSLLRMLLNNHDTLLYRREHNKVLQPAQIICFGDTEQKRKEFFEDEILLADSGLATRALIEYLAATQSRNGTQKPGNDDVEELLAIMSEVVRIGGICDAIHLDVADHTIETLGSGRYGIYDDDFNDNLGGFANARSIESVNLQIEDFDDKMERLAVHEEKTVKEKDSEHKQIDEAFEADWGVTYTNILQFLYVCHLMAVERQTTELEITDKDLIKEAIQLCPELTEDAVKKCLDRFSLDKLPDYLTPPVGFDVKDIFPWIYNRELSYLRRPIVRWQMDDGSVLCMCAFRSCITAGLQLTDLLYSGRLKYVGKKLDSLLGIFESKKGRVFNEEVRSFLQKVPGLTVWPKDVSIKTKGNLIADSDYGDIDVLAYDKNTNILYSIECKNTNTAKNVREMKKEIDDYLGRGDNQAKDQKKALVLKHLRRHQWLVNNIDQVTTFIGATKTPIIKSMMLTASVIPTSYLKKLTSPLSILNYPELKLQGIGYLNSCKEPDVSVLN